MSYQIAQYTNSDSKAQRGQFPPYARPHGLKYRLYYGYPGKCLVRYDNERGKGDHRHERDQEERYTFISVEQLIQDFKTDIERLRGDHHE